MKKAICLTMLVTSLSWIAKSQATEARSQSLLYNLAFEDQTDVFLFPQHLLQYRGLYFHLPASASNLYGGVILGDESQAFGVFVHRPVVSAFDQYRLRVVDTPFERTGILLGSPDESTSRHVPGQVFDLLYGTSTWGVGARFHFWSEVSQQYGVLADPEESVSSAAMDLTGGYNLGNGMDLTGSFGTIFNDSDNEGEILRFLVGMRYIEPTKKSLRMVLAGQLQLGLEIPPSDGDAWFGLGIPLKGGVQIEVIPDELVFGLLGGVDIQFLVPGPGDAKLGLAIPNVEMGAEWRALSWLELRSAIKAGYGIHLVNSDVGDAPKHEQLVFSSGLGFLFGPFRVDTVLRYSQWQNGTYVLSGNSGSVFAGVTLAFVWDSVPSQGRGSVLGSDPKQSAHDQPALVPVGRTESPPEATSAEEEKPGFEGWQGE